MKRTPKIHYFNKTTGEKTAFGFCGLRGTPDVMTSDLKEITCQRCIRMMGRFNIKERDMFVFAFYNCRWLKATTYGLTVGPLIFFQFSKTEHLADPRKRQTLKHELQHVKDLYAYWVIGYLMLYAWDYVTKGYENNRFEVRAREIAAKEPLTDQEMGWLDLK